MSLEAEEFVLTERGTPVIRVSAGKEGSSHRVRLTSISDGSSLAEYVLDGAVDAAEAVTQALSLYGREQGI